MTEPEHHSPEEVERFIEGLDDMNLAVCRAQQVVVAVLHQLLAQVTTTRRDALLKAADSLLAEANQIPHWDEYTVGKINGLSEASKHLRELAEAPSKETT